MNDRIIKTLLALIAVALWGIMLRPILTPNPVQAQGQTNQAQYEFLSISTRYGWESLIGKLNNSAQQGWRAKNIAIQGDNVVVLLER